MDNKNEANVNNVAKRYVDLKVFKMNLEYITFLFIWF